MNDEKKNSEIKTDSLLRDTSTHYIRLIGDADRKARILIVVNSILLTISVTLFTKSIRGHELSPAWISLTLLIISNLVALFFTIASVKPEIHSSVGKDTEDNILHYKKCSEYSLIEYTMKILSMIRDNDKRLEAMIKELHYFGNLLTRKYRLLKIAHSCFFWGILLSVASYLIILWLTNGSASDDLDKLKPISGIINFLDLHPAEKLYGVNIHSPDLIQWSHAH